MPTTHLASEAAIADLSAKVDRIADQANQLDGIVHHLIRDMLELKDRLEAYVGPHVPTCKHCHRAIYAANAKCRVCGKQN